MAHKLPLRQTAFCTREERVSRSGKPTAHWSALVSDGNAPAAQVNRPVVTTGAAGSPTMLWIR